MCIMKFELDVSRTSMENARRRMAMWREAHPQTLFEEPRCLDEDPPWGPLKKEWVKSGEWHTYEGPWPFKPCSHKGDFHVKGGTTISDSHPLAGRRDRKGAFRISPWRNTATKALPARMLENIAACAVVGLTFWAECGIEPSHLWAVDDLQHVHRVRIDRKLQRSEHYCAANYRQTWHEGQKQWVTDAGRKCENRVAGIKSWAKAPTMAALWDQLGPITREQAIDEYHEQIDRMDGPTEEGDVKLMSMDATKAEQAMADAVNHPNAVGAMEKMLTGKALENGPGNPMNQPFPGTPEKDAQVKRDRAARAKQASTRPPSVYDAAGEKPMTREAARALLIHDPDYLGDITNAALVDLLDDESVAEHHGRIRAELTNERGLTERTPA